MKLFEIWNSKQAWSTLSSLKKNPKLSYLLHKYEKKVSAELDACEKIREAIVYECAGVEPPKPPDVLMVRIEPDTDQHRSYLVKFNEAMQNDSDLEWSGITMDALIEALGAETGNVLSEDDITYLEPFFTEPPPKEGALTVVK